MTGGGTSSVWTTVNYPIFNSCGSTKLNTLVNGGYTSVVGTNVTSSCVNPWDSDPSSSFKLINGQMTGQCTFSRPFVYNGAWTI